MEIALLGGGHGCYAAAAEMSEKGHTVRFGGETQRSYLQ